jgi:hypothetical protein
VFTGVHKRPTNTKTCKNIITQSQIKNPSLKIESVVHQNALCNSSTKESTTMTLNFDSPSPTTMPDLPFCLRTEGEPESEDEDEEEEESIPNEYSPRDSSGKSHHTLDYQGDKDISTESDRGITVSLYSFFDVRER